MGRLFVKGPNVMLGYIKPERPGVIEPVAGGWHDTGDVVAIDDEGYIAIKGRLKRFAKIGGEIVSLAVVESIASALWPDYAHAAVAVPDPRKGEQVVLVTTMKGASRHDLVGWAHNHGVPDLAVPRRIIEVDDVPVLGTGKTNYVIIEKLVKDAGRRWRPRRRSLSSQNGNSLSSPAERPVGSEGKGIQVVTTASADCFDRGLGPARPRLVHHLDPLSHTALRAVRPGTTVSLL